MAAKSTLSLHGKSAKEMRELIAARTVSEADVVAYLQSRESLRYPSRQLLKELTGEDDEPAPRKTATPAKAKPVTRPLYGAAKAKHEAKVAGTHKIPSTRMEALGEMALRIAELAKMWGELAE
jgi:hypothetical protein